MPIEDLRERPADSVIDADVCIVGAGPAGMSIALHFAGTGTSVCVLDSGGLTRDDEVEDLNEIESVGLQRAPQELTRARGLGGTSALWSGRCGVFDRIDYARRPWVDGSGWPIDQDDVAPYVDRAGALLGLGPARYGPASIGRIEPSDPNGWDPRFFLPVVFQASLGDPADTEPLRAFAAEGVEGAAHIGVLQHAGAPRPVHFGTTYGPGLAAASNVRVLTHATVTEVETDPAGATATGVAISTLDGRRSRVHARVVVLACGGIDNARLLLLSRGADGGLGNHHDLVGRYLMDHPLAPIAAYDGPGPRDLRRRLGQRWVDVGGVRHVYTLGMRLSPGLQRAEGLLNAQVHLVEFGDRPTALRRAHQALAAARQQGLDRDIASELLAAGLRADRVAAGLYERAVLRRPTLTDADRVELACVVEQVPDPNSRITLSEDRDGLGLARARVDWRAADEEFATLSRVTALLDHELERLGYEAPTRPAWLDDGADGWRATIHDMAHAMGATRMAASPRSGVVDADCQVHGVSGLYVAGGSVFSTSGYMNPTLMIVALALRLADHLEVTLTRPPTVVTSPERDPSATPATRPGRTRVGLVGVGRRMHEVHLPAITALDDRFEVVGFVARSPERRAELEPTLGARGFETAAELVDSSSPDLLVAALAPDAVDQAVPALVDLGVPMLIETPLAWSLRTARAVVERSEGREQLVCVSEQTPFLPLERLKAQVIDLGGLGHVTLAHNDLAVFDYHGIAALRAYMAGPRSPREVSAVTTPFGGGSLTVGTITFDDGAVAVHHFGDAFQGSIGRPTSLRVHGEAGSFVDDNFYATGPDGAAFRSTVARVEDDGRLRELVLELPDGTVRWSNPYADCRLDDEQLAVAHLLVGTAEAARHGGDGPYPARESLLDMEILTAMRYSASRGGSPVRVPVSALDQVRGFDRAGATDRVVGAVRSRLPGRR